MQPVQNSAFARYWRLEQLPFIGIPDPHHQLADHFGQQVKLLKLGRLPALIVIDKTGKIRYRHYGDSMMDIPPNADVLASLDRSS
jgi:peroxiredoxin Q/BCP